MNPIRKRWLIGWAVAVAAIGIWLIFADKPWGPIMDDVVAREKIGKQIKVRHYATITLWWTGLSSWVILIFSGLRIRWWATPLSAVARGFEQRKKTPRLVWVGLITIVALGAGLRIPLAGKSLAVDELWNAKSTIVGYYLGKPDDPLEDRYFGAASYPRAMWLYSRPNNHPVASVAAHFSHQTFSNLIDPDRLPHEFRDITVRLPTLLVSLICIGIVGMLGVRFISPTAGLVAAFLLATQPWHIRFGVEIRAYSWVFLWTLLGVWCLTKIFQKSKPARWRYWFWFGLNQALLVWSFPYAAFLAGGFFIGATALTFHAWPDRGNRITALRRLVFVNIMAALLFIHFFGPNLLQTREWITTVNQNHQNHGLDAFWFGKTILQSTIGHTTGNPAVSWIFAAFAILSAGWGGLILWKKTAHRPLFITLGSIVLGVALSFVFFKITGTFFYPRFVSFGLVSIIFLIAIGWTAIKPNVILPLLGCLTMVSISAPRLRELSQKPLEPLRDVADLLESQDREIIPVGYGHSTEYLPVYLPATRKPLTNRAALEAVIAESRAEDRPLFIIIGRPEYNRATMPEGFTLLDDPTIFEERVTFDAAERHATYRVLKLQNDPTGSDR